MVLAPVWADDIISGKVVDFLSGVAITGVEVKIVEFPPWHKPTFLPKNS
jgi:hypothetical protein